MKRLQDLQVPIPPVMEQKRIVAKVDQLMALCDDLEAKQTKKRDLATQSTHSALTALTTAETGSDVTVAWERLARNFGDALRNAEDISAFREAVVALAVQGRLTSALSAAKPRSTAKSEPSPEPWPSLSLGEIVVAMDAGWSPNCPPCATETEKEWGVLRTTAVQRNRFLPEHHKALPPGLLPRPQLEVTPGDLLVTRAGPTARVGIACAVSDVRGRLMLSDKIIRAKLDARRADAEYVALALNSGMSREFLRASQSGMDLAQVNISQDRLRKVPISLPSLAEQRRIVAKVDDLMSLLDDLEAKLRKQEETATRLAESLAAAVAA
jgi:type I restriction enzyme S subunit